MSDIVLHVLLYFSTAIGQYALTRSGFVVSFPGQISHCVCLVVS